MLLAALAGWYDVRRARSQLEPAAATLRTTLADVDRLRTAEGRTSARRDLAGAAERLRAARRHLSSSVPLAALRPIPYVGRQRAAAIALVDDAVAAADDAHELLRRADEIGRDQAVTGGTVPVDAVDRLGSTATATANRLRRSVRGSGGLMAPLAAARRELDTAARDAADRLDRTGKAVRATASFLGARGPRRYLLAVENNAEMRARGMMLSYGVVEVTDGRLEFSRTGSVDTLVLRTDVDVPIPPGTRALFGGLRPSYHWQNTNATPDLDVSSTLQLAMFERVTGERLDGVIAVDVPGLAALLAVVGPVDAPEADEPLTSTNVARILLNDLYARFESGSQDVRRERLGDVAAAIVTALRTRSVDEFALAESLGSAAAGGHFRLWSTRRAETVAFERAGLSGGPAVEDPDRTFHVTVQNATATKLDYFVRPTVEMDVTLTPSGAAVVRTTVTIANAAPRGAPASYQLGPQPGRQDRPGQYIGRVYLWGPAGSEQLDSVEESGLRANATVVTAEPGGTATTSFTTVIHDAVRGGRVDLRLVPQPRLDPAELRIRFRAPGRQVEGPGEQVLVWDHTVRPSWGVK